MVVTTALSAMISVLILVSKVNLIPPGVLYRQFFLIDYFDFDFHSFNFLKLLFAFGVQSNSA